MSTFQSNNAFFGTEAKVGGSGTINNTKLSATNLVVTGATTLLSTTYSGTGIASNVSTGNGFDITTKGLTFNNLAGAVGNLVLSGGSTAVPTFLASPAVGNFLTSGGVASAPVWAPIPTTPTAFVIQRGTITPAALAVTGTQALSGFASIPFVQLTVNTEGTTIVIPVSLGAVSTTSFTYILGTALTGTQKINWLAIE